MSQDEEDSVNPENLVHPVKNYSSNQCCLFHTQPHR